MREWLSGVALGCCADRCFEANPRAIAGMIFHCSLGSKQVPSGNTCEIKAARKGTADTTSQCPRRRISVLYNRYSQSTESYEINPFPILIASKFSLHMVLIASDKYKIACVAPKKMLRCTNPTRTDNDFNKSSITFILA